MTITFTQGMVITGDHVQTVNDLCNELARVRSELKKSRKQALAECVAEIRGMKANHKVAQSAINQCAEALEFLK